MTKCAGADPYNLTDAPNVKALKGTMHSSCECIDKYSRGSWIKQNNQIFFKCIESNAWNYFVLRKFDE